MYIDFLWEVSKLGYLNFEIVQNDVLEQKKKYWNVYVDFFSLKKTFMEIFHSWMLANDDGYIQNLDINKHTYTHDGVYIVWVCACEVVHVCVSILVCVCVWLQRSKKFGDHSCRRAAGRTCASTRLTRLFLFCLERAPGSLWCDWGGRWQGPGQNPSDVL